MKICKNIEEWLDLWVLPRNYKTGTEWDAKLNDLLDQAEAGEIDVKLTRFTIVLGTTSVWRENWPYSYGYDNYNYPTWLPKRKTAARLRKYERVCNSS